jgi:hypothetical protein
MWIDWTLAMGKGNHVVDPVYSGDIPNEARVTGDIEAE